MGEDRREVRDAVPAELDAVAHCLGRAFETDPISLYLFPRASSRPRRLPRFYRLVAREMGAVGRVMTSDGVPGAALWRAPSPPRPTRWQGYASAARFIAVLGSAVVRSRAFFEELERVHIREPHWYLAVLGTEPARQGEGIGSALLRPMLAKCAADGVPAYLESSKEENIPFYQRHGFEVQGKVDVEGAPIVWPMLFRP